MNEEWKDILGFEGSYQISNLGRVKSLARICLVFGNKKKILKEIIMVQFINRCGHKVVFLRLPGFKRKYFVHRLVAQSFIENPLNKAVVNHIDCDKHNNHVTNLEWMTSGENTRYHFEQIKKSNATF